MNGLNLQGKMVFNDLKRLKRWEEGQCILHLCPRLLEMCNFSRPF